MADAALLRSAFVVQEAARKYSSNIHCYQDTAAWFASQEFETKLSFIIAHQDPIMIDYPALVAPSKVHSSGRK